MTGVRDYTVACNKRVRIRVEEICKALEFSHEDVIGPSRRRPIIEQRYMVATILRSEDFSLERIAHGLRRDHSTVHLMLNEAARERKRARSLAYHHRKKETCAHCGCAMRGPHPNYKDCCSYACARDFYA